MINSALACWWSEAFLAPFGWQDTCYVLQQDDPLGGDHPCRTGTRGDKKGVLTVVVPKTKQAREEVKRVEIKAE